MPIPFRHVSPFALRSFTFAAAAALAGCSSSSSAPSAPASDAGTVADVAVADAGPPLPDVPEPVWSGTTIEPGCTTNGCIRSLTKTTAYVKGILAGQAAAGFTVDNGIAIYAIHYMSDGAEITGSLYVPDSAPPADGFPVVVMNQFTTGLGAPCAPSVGALGIGVASPTALHGILTLVPDSTSFGTSPYGGYMIGKISGRAALDGARAAFHTGSVIGQTVARKAVIAGLSQGAHSTMSAASQLLGYATHLEVKGFAAVAPPHAMRAGYAAEMQADQGVTTYVAMRLYSWQGTLGLSGGPIFKEPYATNAPTWFANDCVFKGSTGGSGALYGDFPTTPSLVFTDTFLNYGKTDSWPDDWAAQYAASEPVPTNITQPIIVFQGSADTTVPQADTDKYIAELTAAGVTVDYRVVAGTQHTTTALSSFTVVQPANNDAVAWIKDKLQ